MSQFVLTFTSTYFWKQLQSTFYFMLQFLQWTILRMLWVKGVFSLYLSISGLPKAPGKFLTGVLEKSWVFSSERGGTLSTTSCQVWQHDHLILLFTRYFTEINQVDVVAVTGPIYTVVGEESNGDPAYELMWVNIEATWIVTDNTSSSWQCKFNNVSQWRSDNNLRLIQNKTFEIIFSARSNHGIFTVLALTLPNIQRVTNIKALGMTITSQLSMNPHVDTLVESCGTTLYGLRVLRAHGMSDDRIQELFRSIVTAKLTYASQAWSGFCTASDINKLDWFLARCKRLN